MTVPVGNRDSWLCRLHPLVKLGWLAGATAAVFVSDSPAVATALAAAALLGLCAAGLPPWRLPGRGTGGLLVAAVLAVHVLAAWGGAAPPGAALLAGLARGALAAGRMLTVLLGSAVFVATTDPADLGESLIALRLPYRWAFALVTALRLAPAFRLEASNVYRAQLARGVRYDAGPLRRRWRMLRRLLLPLVISSLRTAGALAATMENRSFGQHRRRTSLRRVRFRRADAAALAGGGALLAAAALWGLAT